MARNKKFSKKMKLIHEGKKSNTIPTWIVMRTKGKVRTSPFTRRHWRSSKLKV